jgi:propanol-preferring alcohol dehydrogenase
MQAARFHGPEEGLVVESVPRPDPGPGELLVEVGACGLCHSDLHLLSGELPVPTPVTLGHEVAGTVVETGAGVDDPAPGTPVVVYGGWGCGDCRACTRGEDQLCNVLEWCGIGADGGLAEYLRVPDTRYVLPAPGLDPVAAAPLTDAALTPYRAVDRARDHLGPADTVVCVGVGGLGQFGVQFAAMTGAEVVAVDVDPDKLALADDLGADATVDASTGTVPSAIRDAAGGEVAVAIDFVGDDDTLQWCGNVLGTGGRLYVVGIGDGSYEVAFNPLVGAEIAVTNVFWGSINQLQDVLALADAGRLEVTTEVVGFDDLAATYDRLEAGGVAGRAVFTP